MSSLSNIRRRGFAWGFRKVPVRRSLHGAWIRRAAGWKEFPHYVFTTNVAGIKWSTETMPDLLVRHLLFEGLYQEEVVIGIQALARPSGVVFDVGAHHGFMSMVASAAVGERGRVVAFEPNPLALNRLRTGLELNQTHNVQVMPVAVGDHAGQVTLNVQKGTASWNTSIFRDVIVGNYEVEQVEVPMTTIDQFVAESGLIPDMMKIDVEGSEFLVIRGAEETIRTHRPALIMEFNPVAAAAADTTIDRLVQDLTTLGYALRVLRRNRWGRYAFSRSEPFEEARHCRDDLANILCVPVERREG